MPRPALSPGLVCKDVDKTYEWFTQTLGFGGQGKWAGPDGRTMHASVVLPTRHGEAHVMLGPYDMAASSPEAGEFGANLPKGPLGNGVGLWFLVPDVDRYHAFLQGKGADIVQGPTDQFWGDRTVMVRAPDGYFLHFVTPIKGFQAPPGMGERDGQGATQPTAPRTAKLKLPGARKPAARKAPPKARAKAKAKATAAKRRR